MSEAPGALKADPSAKISADSSADPSADPPVDDKDETAASQKAMGFALPAWFLGYTDSRYSPWLAFVLGLLSVRGLPPYGDVWVLIVAFAVFFRLLHGVRWWRGVWYGFLFGLGHFWFGFSWLITSLHDHGGLNMPVAQGMLLGLAGAMAVYTALFGGLFPLFTQRPWFSGLAAPSLWAALEWLRGIVLTGFPWNPTGIAWDGWLGMIQVADLGGVYLLSWLALFPAGVVAALWRQGVSRRELGVGLGGVVLIVAVAAFYGHYRLEDLARREAENVWTKPMQMALVQGNIPQKRKWDPSFQDETLSVYLDLSRSIPVAVDLVVWPETAVPLFLQASLEELKQIGQLSHELGASILTGAPMADRNEAGGWRFYNSMVLIDEEMSLGRRYDKHHLVPFGEFIPFREWVPDTFKKFTEGTEDFSRGPGSVPLSWGEGGEIGALVCYEAIFPEEVRQLALNGARWLVNVTNDAWFGELAKHQHLAMARLRAVENRLPLIRVANTGISAAFDQMGRELVRIPANQRDVVVVTVPRGVEESFFRRSGSSWIGVWLGLCVALLVMGRLRWLGGGRA
ncbi:MAG: apolipoprotein N-acyltransferase [Magnetococcales bacterium]|nr:apolipoprotein N-acyltransferase [Magnetococcales bacterium]